jgi:hypothetical protein
MPSKGTRFESLPTQIVPHPDNEISHLKIIYGKSLFSTNHYFQKSVSIEFWIPEIDSL